MKVVMRFLFKLLGRYLIVLNWSYVWMIHLVFIYVSFYYLKQMKMLGIKSRLDQVFDAPAAVRDVLISQFALDHSVCVLWILFSSFCGDVWKVECAFGNFLSRVLEMQALLENVYSVITWNVLP